MDVSWRGILYTAPRLVSRFGPIDTGLPEPKLNIRLVTYESEVRRFQWVNLSLFLYFFPFTDPVTSGSRLYLKQERPRRSMIIKLKTKGQKVKRKEDDLKIQRQEKERDPKLRSSFYSRTTVFWPPRGSPWSTPSPTSLPTLVPGPRSLGTLCPERTLVLSVGAPCPGFFCHHFTRVQVLPRIGCGSRVDDETLTTLCHWFSIYHGLVYCCNSMSTIFCFSQV